MGWSCSKYASDTLEKIERNCILYTGSQNTWYWKGKKHFFEISRKEYEDGSICGSIYRFYDDMIHCKRVANFKIDGNGKLTKSSCGLSKLTDERIR